MWAGSSIRACAIIALSAIVSFGPASTVAHADNQTPTVSKVSTDTSTLPYTIQIRLRNMPFVLPSLQAFSAGQISGLWVLIGGRTSGLHGFTKDPLV